MNVSKQTAGSNRTVAFTSLLASAEYLKATLARRGVRCVDLVDADVRCPPDPSTAIGTLRIYADTHPDAPRYSAKDLAPAAAALTEISADFVLYGCEHNIAAADRLAEMVCPRYANDPATAPAREWKDETNRLLAARGFRVPREVSFALHEPFDADRLEGLPDRFIIKAVRYSANHPVVSKDEFEAWLAAQRSRDPDPGARYTAQELLIEFDDEGMQESFSIDGFAIGGEQHFISLQSWRKHVLDDGFRYCWADQLDVRADEHAALLRHASSVLSALGMKNGFFHSDFTASPDGPVLIDLNPRIAGAGGIVDKMIAAAQGTGVIDAFVDVAYDERTIPVQPCRQVRLLAIYGLTAAEVGEVARYPTVSDIYDSEVIGCHFVLFADTDAEKVAEDAESCFRRFVARQPAERLVARGSQSPQ